MKKIKIFFIGILALWQIGFDTLLTLVSVSKGDSRSLAIMCMTWGLTICWIVIGGMLMVRYRDKIKKYVQNIRAPWQVVFVVFATVLALTEEIVTVTMTNLAPQFGSQIGVAYITASTNYFDVVLFHSVIVFIPMFIGWAWLLGKYDFTPFSVFLLFGIMGIVAEISLGGPTQLFASARWIFVYGLMVYLPAYCIPQGRAARVPHFWQYLLAIPKVFAYSFPMLVAVVLIVAKVLHHPSIHFVQQ